MKYFALLFFSLILLTLTACTTSISESPPGDAPAKEPFTLRRCAPKSVSLELGRVVLEHAAKLPRAERGSVCRFVSSLCIDFDTGSCSGDRVACLTYEGRDDERQCSVIRIAADYTKVDFAALYDWVAAMLTGV
jgi:hypothetical protein